MHVDDRVTAMVMNTIQSNRMPTDGGVQRGGRGAEEDILLDSSLHISYGEVYVRRSSGLRDLDGYSTVCTSIISSQSMIDDEAVARGRDLR